MTRTDTHDDAPHLKKTGTLPIYDEYLLLGEQTRFNKGKKTLVLDVDETLCHATTWDDENADFSIDVRQDGRIETFHVRKRPFVDEFLAVVGKLYELVFFSAAS